MIHRKWSLLTGPATIVGGVVAAVAAANFIFVKNTNVEIVETPETLTMQPKSQLQSEDKRNRDPFLKPEERKFENQPATKNV
ncbi:hypothetical protein CR513_15866, partial [Mucuna pruriens]